MIITRWCICEAGPDGKPAVAQYANEWSQTYDVSVGGPRLRKVEATFFSAAALRLAQADPKIMMFPSRHTPAGRISQKMQAFFTAARVTAAAGDRASDMLRKVRNRFGQRFTRDISDPD